MDFSEKMDFSRENRVKAHLFMESIEDEEVITELSLVLDEHIGVLTYHESLASIAKTKEEFLSHVQEIEQATREVEDVFRKHGFELYHPPIMETIQHKSGILGKLNSKAVELGLVENISA